MKQINYFMIVMVLFAIVSDVLLLDKKKHGKPQKSERKHKKGKSKKDPGHRIIEGTKVINYADYPFIVSLISEQFHLCGGSIITDSVILTAGHCCFDDDDTPLAPELLSVAVGSIKWKKARRYFKVRKLVVHEHFDKGSLENDIALWALKEKLSPSDNVDIIRLHRQPVHEENKVIATVLGWGYTSKNGLMVSKASDDLLMVKIYSITSSECRKHHDDLNDGQICFSSPDRRGSCFGDSGGPLVMRKDSKLVQIGLVSYGEDCNNTAPEVYTRMSAYYMWIKEHAVKLRLGKKKHNK